MTEASPHAGEASGVRAFWEGLGLPGLFDVHVHFLPPNIQRAVYAVFDSAGPKIGREWPIRYRQSHEDRVELLRAMGVRRFPTLPYAHKPGVATYLNDWAAGFTREVPESLWSATFFPEPDAAAYVGEAIADGVEIFKVHLQVGDYDPNEPVLEEVWELIDHAALPVVMHCGSGPSPGRFTGPAPIRRLLARHRGLRLVIAHMGMPEYRDFLDICEESEHVRLDTTMVFTPFTDETMPFPADQMGRLPHFVDRILFGSDFPNIPYGFLDALRVLTGLPGVDDGWLRKVLHDNAAHLFQLDT